MENSKNIKVFKNLDDNDIKQLEKILDVEISVDAVAARRKEFPEDDFTFLELAMDEYSSQLEERLVSDDYKWDEEYVLDQVQRVLPQFNIEYLPDYEDKEYDGTTLHFNLNGTVHNVETPRHDIEYLFNYLNNLLEPYDKKFVSLNESDEGLSFLLVPQSVDEKQLKNIVYAVTTLH